jgi:hypothetical protein
MSRPYRSAIRIKRLKPSTRASRKRVVELRALLRRRMPKADRLRLLDELNVLAPPVSGTPIEGTQAQ